VFFKETDVLYEEMHPSFNADLEILNFSSTIIDKVVSIQAKKYKSLTNILPFISISGHIDAAPCVIIFLLVYYFLMASAVWFAILAMSWDICFHSLTVPSDFFSGKTHYLHAIAWTLPLIKTIAILILREVDGDKLSGICFVGYQNLDMRAWFVFGPLGVYLTFGGFFLLRGAVV
jgi:hypothetical protein